MAGYIAYSQHRVSQLASIESRLWAGSSNATNLPASYPRPSHGATLWEGVNPNIANAILAYGGGGSTKSTKRTHHYQHPRWPSQVILRSPSELHQKIVLRRRERRDEVRRRHHRLLMMQQSPPALTTMQVDEDEVAFTTALAASLPPFFLSDFASPIEDRSSSTVETIVDLPMAAVPAVAPPPSGPVAPQVPAKSPLRDSGALIQQLMSETELCLEAYSSEYHPSETPVSPMELPLPPRAPSEMTTSSKMELVSDIDAEADDKAVPGWAEQVMSWRDFDD